MDGVVDWFARFVEEGSGVVTECIEVVVLRATPLRDITTSDFDGRDDSVRVVHI